MKKTNIITLMCFACLVLFSCKQSSELIECSIIPLPNEWKSQQGSFVLEKEINVSLPAQDSFLNGFHCLVEALKETSIRLTTVAETQQAPIRFRLDPTLPDEAYTLAVSTTGVEITSNATGAGLFYGVQSLVQLMPSTIFSISAAALTTLELPLITIHDAPRFPYRGAMMDVGRNFLPKEEVLKFIDLMAKYKMNRFHFHLTDDQGWRIEIKKYPKLTEVGGYRNQTQVGHCDYYWPRRYDGIEKHGFYTQEEIKEIVQYATQRFITVVPEIEMPGHSSAALAAYPQFSCGLGKAYTVRDYFDIFDEVYCPRPETFAFLEDVLTEVIDLFPSHYIHIGGDECPKKAWKKCSHCQTLMKQEGLKTEEELQSYFIRKMERFVNSKGRDIIGWDEILEGGLAPNATVMSWRGEEGGIIAAQQAHQVIMTPGKTCYFDFYQEDPEFAPQSIGHFLPLDSVYAYNPLPAALTLDEQKYIIGAQANIWGEYIQTPQQFEYMAFPRLLAMAEVQWTQLANKSFNSFASRLDAEFKRLNYYGVNACRNFYEVNMEGCWNAQNGAYEVILKTFCPDAEIHYALNDSLVTAESPLYTSAVELSENSILYAAVYRGKQQLGVIKKKNFSVSKALGCNYLCSDEPQEEQTNKGFGMTDGYYGYPHDLYCWTIFDKDAVQLTIELKEPNFIKQVLLASLWRPCNAIWPVKQIEVATSMNGTVFTTAGKTSNQYFFTETEGTRYPITVSFAETEAKFVRLTLQSFGNCPRGYYNENKQSRMSFDEIEIN